MTNRQLLEKIIYQCKINISDLKLSDKVKVILTIETYFPEIISLKKHLVNDNDYYFAIGYDGMKMMKGSESGFNSNAMYNDGFRKDTRVLLDYKDFYNILKLDNENTKLEDVYKALIYKNNDK